TITGSIGTAPSMPVHHTAALGNPKITDRVKLSTFAQHLLPQAKAHAATMPPGSEEYRSLRLVIARTAEMDAVPLPADLELRVWHGACLATAVTDLLAITEEAADHAA
ncbi:DUF6415 family natural product biosynthesis protein, partial [Streptomyces syringium]|uniref:DUF6415 family natural product biosynthesis protein n=1 Tax=Streptomyces syringium TaxID=76729 RepID=UPI0033C2F63D